MTARAVRAAGLLGLAVSLMLPASAKAAVRVFVYPLVGEGANAAAVQSAEAVVQSALVARDTIRPGAQSPLPASCGADAKAGSKCIARLARGGVVLTGRLRPGNGPMQLTLWLTDAAGRTAGPARTLVDVEIEDPRPVAETIEVLAAQLAAAPVVAAAPPPVLSPADAAPVAPNLDTPSSRPAERAAPAAAVEAQDEHIPAEPGAWMKPAGAWAMGGGVVALAGGALFGYLAMRGNADLTEKFNNNGLRASDRANYDALARNSKVANVLFAVGGVSAATGIVLWGIAPAQHGFEANVGGTF